MAGSTFSRIKTWIAGQTLTASDLNAEYDNILSNLDPTGIDDESASNAAAQATKDPYAGSSLVKAVSLEEEIQELRYMIKQITGETYWYIDTDTDIASIYAGSQYPGFFIRPKFTFVESLDFTSGGTHELVVGDTVEGAAGGATGYVEHITLSTGAWADGNAAGVLYLNTRNATAFQAAEVLKDNGNGNCATVTAASAKDSILISPFVYHHQGTSEQFLYSDSNIAFEFQNLGTSDWSYLYFDDSAIVTAGTNLITATQLVDAVTESAFSEAKHGEYNGEDKAIFAVFTDGSNNILEFFHDSNLVLFADRIVSASTINLDQSWTEEVTLTVPIFARKVNVAFDYRYGNVNSDAYWRTEGQTGDIGHLVGDARVAGNIGVVNTDVICSSNLKIQTEDSAAGSNLLTTHTNGWYFPTGM